MRRGPLSRHTRRHQPVWSLGKKKSQRSEVKTEEGYSAGLYPWRYMSALCLHNKKRHIPREMLCGRSADTYLQGYMSALYPSLVFSMTMLQVWDEKRMWGSEGRLYKYTCATRKCNKKREFERRWWRSNANHASGVIHSEGKEWRKDGRLKRCLASKEITM